MKKILIAEDNVEISAMMKSYLVKAGYEVLQAYDGEQALDIAKAEQIDLALLDIMMPKKDGYEVCTCLRERLTIPIIVVSARVSEEDKVRMFELGADDYITKPFLPEELILRVTAVLKRAYRVKVVQEEEKVALGNCVVDLGSGMVRWNDPKNKNRDDGTSGNYDREGEVALTAKEYAILQKLAQERGRIVTIDALCDAVWQEENFGYENTLVVHIRRLREKIEEDPSHPQYLLTVRGLGYRLV